MPTGVYTRTEVCRLSIGKAMSIVNSGRRHTKRSKENMSKAHIGKKLGPHSEEWNKNIRDSLKGKPYTKERRERMSKAKKSKHLKMTKKQRKHLSEKLTGIKRSKEFCEKIRKALKGNEKLSLSGIKQAMKRSYHWSKHYYQGYFYSKKNKKKIRYKSGFEYSFLILLEISECVIKYEIEPFYLSYKYQGNIKHYIPDVLIYLEDESKQLIEVKQSHEIKTKINQAKFKVAKKYCKEKNIEFRIWTEDGFLN